MNWIPMDFTCLINNNNNKKGQKKQWKLCYRIVACVDFDFGLRQCRASNTDYSYRTLCNFIHNISRKRALNKMLTMIVSFLFLVLTETVLSDLAASGEHCFIARNSPNTHCTECEWMKCEKNQADDYLRTFLWNWNTIGMKPTVTWLNFELIYARAKPSTTHTFETRTKKIIF